MIPIKDNGVGLTKKKQEQIFQPFGKIERYGQGVDAIIEGPGLRLRDEIKEPRFSSPFLSTD